MPPTYDWSDGVHDWSVITTVSERDNPSACPECGKPGIRQLTLPCPVSPTAGDWNRQEFNHGLGCYTKSWKDARQIAKRRGLEEVGNEPTESLHKTAESRRAEIRAQRWQDADKE